MTKASPLPHLPDLKQAHRDCLLMWIDYYLATELPGVGKGGGILWQADDDQYHDDNPAIPIPQRAIDNHTKRYCAEIFIEKFLNLCGEMNFPPELVGIYLDHIINFSSTPDEVIDAALTAQEKLIEIIPSFASVQNDIRREYARQIGDLTPK